MKKLFYKITALLCGPRIVAWILVHFELQDQICLGKPAILVHSRSIFSKDITSLKHSEALQYIILSNGLLSAIQGVWLPIEAQNQTYYFNQLKERTGGWVTCNLFADNVLSILQEKCALLGVLSANFDYWQDAAFRNACERSEISFMVLRRENEATRKAFNQSLQRYRDVQIGNIDLALTFSESSKLLLKSIDSNGLSFRKIEVTGPPRLDRNTSVIANDQLETKDTIVLFSYINGNYCEDPRNFWEVLVFLYQFTLKEDRDLLIKCKSERDRQILMNEFPSYSLDPGKVSWSVRETTAQAVSRACCAVSFNSTVLYELLSMPVPLVVPFVYVSENEMNDAILYDARGAEEASGVFHAISIEEFGESIQKALSLQGNIDVSHEVRSRLREKGLSWHPHKSSSQRVAEAILAYKKIL